MAGFSVSKSQKAILRLWSAASREDRRRYMAAVAFVLLLHLAVFWVLLLTTGITPKAQSAQDMMVTMLSPATEHPKDSQIIVPKIVLPEVVPPEIQITPESDPANAIAHINLNPVLITPRPDPHHPNSTPPIPQTAGAASLNPVTLRIRVIEDGTIEDAQIAASSGDASVDEIVLGFVKNNWRLLPATFGGKPIPHWTTVTVRFQKG